MALYTDLHIIHWSHKNRQFM